jgi:hypothetical protein
MGLVSVMGHAERRAGHKYQQPQASRTKLAVGRMARRGSRAGPSTGFLRSQPISALARWSISPSCAGASSATINRRSGSGTLKGADGAASTFTRACASQLTDSSSPSGERFPLRRRLHCGCGWKVIEVAEASLHRALQELVDRKDIVIVAGVGKVGDRINTVPPNHPHASLREIFDAL